MNDPVSLAATPSEVGNAAARVAAPFYIIATSPRTGSTLLTEALAATRLAGLPDEYFDIHAKNEQNWINRFRIPKGAGYIDRVQAATRTPNGVFGLKLHWHQMPALANRLVELRPESESQVRRPIFDLLKERFPGVRFIWLIRKNRVAQAISYYRASETDVWRIWNDQRPVAPPSGKKDAYSRAEIERHLRIINNMDAGWQRFFAEHKIRPLLFSYEDLVQSYEQVVRRVLTFLDLPADGPIVPPALQRLANVESEEWERRFRKEMSHARAPATAQKAAPVVQRRAAAAKKTTSVGTGLPLIAYDVGSPMKTNLVPGRPTRAWMNATPNRFAYRCLPMVIANQWGWMIETLHRVEAVWDGSQPPEGLTITADGDKKVVTASSHFGSGVLTFNIGFLFRTPPGFNLHVRGPANWPKDGACALEGIVETDWVDSTFTMNWKLTRPNHPVVFEAGEPIAMISPVRRGQLEEFLAEIQPLSADQATSENYTAWSKSRDSFNADLKVTGSAAKKAGWQKDYTRGRTVTGGAAPEHQTALELKDFLDKR
jgi:LPS sulfotransferase NodH